jgi:hypothetical protein
MDNKKIKRIIAREGLIALGLAIALYFLVTLFLQNVPVVLPRYKLVFANGEAHAININPEIRNDSNYKKLLEETYNPSLKLIEKRIKEFIKAGNIKSTLKSSNCINSGRIYISKLYSYLLEITFILKLAIAYFILLFMRFVIWAIRALREKK